MSRRSTATGNTITGNYIGANSAGTAALANSGHGILLVSETAVEFDSQQRDFGEHAGGRGYLGCSPKRGRAPATSSARMSQRVPGRRSSAMAGKNAVKLGGQNDRIGTNADGSNDVAEQFDFGKHPRRRSALCLWNDRQHCLRQLHRHRRDRYGRFREHDRRV